MTRKMQVRVEVVWLLLLWRAERRHNNQPNNVPVAHPFIYL